MALQEKLKLPAVVLMVTEDCNFNCTYCFQTKANRYMTWETAKRALDFFLPELKENYRVTFTGGEPLLALDVIKESVSYLETKNREQGKSATYAVVTNGSLLDDDCLDFLNRHNFIVALSFDGYGQNKSRRENSFDQTAAVIKKALTLKHITLNVNSTFAPEGTDHIRKSMEFILGLGVKHLSLALDITRKWNRASQKKLAAEMDGLIELSLQYYKGHKTVPLDLFRESGGGRGVWRCSAGRSQLTVLPGGDIWGCPCFYEYFKGKEGTREYDKYYFGNLTDFAKNHGETYPRVLSRYSIFRMDNYYKANSRCFLCPLLEKCGVCPVMRPNTGRPLRYVHSHICEVKKILIKGKDNFLKKLNIST